MWGYVHQAEAELRVKERHIYSQLTGLSSLCCLRALEVTERSGPLVRIQSFATNGPLVRVQSIATHSCAAYHLKHQSWIIPWCIKAAYTGVTLKKKSRITRTKSRDQIELNISPSCWLDVDAAGAICI